MFKSALCRAVLAIAVISQAAFAQTKSEPVTVVKAARFFLMFAPGRCKRIP